MSKQPTKTLYATDLDCIVCGKQADVFWPMIDLDIQAHPHCNACCLEKKIKLMMNWHEKFDEKETEKDIKVGF